MARLKKTSQVGSSTVRPDGSLEIRTDEGIEDLVKALDFWFPIDPSGEWQSAISYFSNKKQKDQI